MGPLAADLAGMLISPDFANTYVADQLAQQKISFKTADTLTAEDKTKPCLVQQWVSR